MHLLAPRGADPAARTLVACRALRAFVDGYVAVLLPAYLLALGLDAWAVGVLSTATLLGSAVATLAVGAWGHRFGQRPLLLGAALLMFATGVGFAGLVGLLAPAARGIRRHAQPKLGRRERVPAARARATRRCRARRNPALRLFARYSLIASLSAAIGALAAAPPGLAFSPCRHRASCGDPRGLFADVCPSSDCSRSRSIDGCPKPPQLSHAAAKAPLGPSRRVVLKLAALFSVDAFAGGLVLNSLMSLWLMQRFEPLARRRGHVLLLDGPALGRLAARRSRRGAAHRATEHDGLHAHPGQSVSRACSPGAQPSARTHAALHPQRAVADGCSDAQRPT